MSTFEGYLDALQRNRAIFRGQSPDIYATFEASVAAFMRLGEELRKGRDSNGKTHISLAPLHLIFQRQAMAAFDALASNQAFVAWSLVRPGIEAALMLSKWIDDPTNATVWHNKNTDWKAYRALFEGKNLQSVSLPRSAAIQSALSRINDYFLHPNPDYYFRHLELTNQPEGQVKLAVNFFDEPIEMAVGVLGILHLVIVVQDALAEMLARLYSRPRVEVGLKSFEEHAGNWAQATMKEGPWPTKALTELGLWPRMPGI